MYTSIWLLFLSVVGCLASRSPIWPQPAQVQLGDEALWLSYPFNVEFRCEDHESAVWKIPASGSRGMLLKQMKQTIGRGLSSVQQVLKSYLPHYFDDSEPFSILSEVWILRSAIDEAFVALHEESFVPWKFHRRQSQFEPEFADAGSSFDGLLISQKQCPPDSFNPTDFFDGDESYELLIERSQAQIRCNSTLGALRALQSLKQLFYAHTTSKGVYTPFSPAHITDRPRWRHRGLSLDIARNAFLPEDVMKTIGGMAATKLSRLHLHATDSQSWPLDIPALPLLAKRGAYHPDLVWSKKDLETVQRYGVLHGVMVFVEIDTPGHTASVAQAYPDLIAAFNELDWSTFAAEPESGQLKLDSEKVRGFLDVLFEDLLPRLEPYSTLYHCGGDEINSQVHLLDETVTSNDTKVLQPLVQRFLDQVLGHVDRHTLRPIVWEEMVLDWHLDVVKPRLGGNHEKMLVQVWRDPDRITKVLEKGHSVIFGDYKHWYLDCGFGQFFDPYSSGLSPPGVPHNTSGGVPTQIDPLFLDYCQPFHNWRAVYTFDPLQGVSEHLQPGIEGGEVLLWSELTDPVNLDFKLWPRTAAAAEVLWSGPRSWEQIADATWRLGHFRERLVLNHGVASSPVQMTWCLMEGGCEY